MNEQYETLNRHFVAFWSVHKRRHNCGSVCSKAFVTDGFQKSGRFICGNTKKTIHNVELGKKRRFLFLLILLSIIFNEGIVQIGCGNRPDYGTKRKTNEDREDESVLESTASQDVPRTNKLCKTCKLNSALDNIEEESITNTECNINRNPRFVNVKARSYGLIYTMYNCGIIVDFLEINLSEQVYITLLHWINMLRKINNLNTIPKIFIYDNACSVWIYYKKRLHVTKTISLTPITAFIDSCDMYIDRLHQKTHTRPICLKDRNIDTRPDLTDINTVICEQTNSWLKQYLNMLCNFSGERSTFYYFFLFHHRNCEHCSLDPEKH
jgi:hypothetical protein